MKRALDLVASAVALVLGLPVLLLVALVVALSMGRPILFMQERAGLTGRPFRMAKFRTMADSRTPEGDHRPDQDRLTAGGRVLGVTPSPVEGGDGNREFLVGAVKG